MMKTLRLLPASLSARIACIACISCLATSADAGIVTHLADTTAGPAFNRPIAAGDGSLSGPSSVGTAVRYDAYRFSVDTAGDYSFLTTGVYDTYTFLYSPTFGSMQPLTNALKGNDDFFGIGNSAFTYALQSGVAYTLVTTGYANIDAGFASTTIGGRGTITPAVAETAVTSSPNVLTFTGDTTAATTYDRLLEDLSEQSSIGTAVAYRTFRFRVATSGFYSFLTTGDFDTFDFLYSPSLDPSAPLSNALYGNDDLFGIGPSGLLANLVADVDYTLVTTGFGNGDFGFFSTTIGGPGAILAAAAVNVPEPGMFALLLVGAAAMGRTRRTSAALRAA